VVAIPDVDNINTIYEQRSPETISRYTACILLWQRLSELRYQM